MAALTMHCTVDHEIYMGKQLVVSVNPVLCILFVMKNVLCVIERVRACDRKCMCMSVCVCVCVCVRKRDLAR